VQLEDLDEVEEMNEKIKLEKFISDIDNRLVQLFSKMISSGIKNLEPTVKLDEINEDEIKEFVRDLILGDEDPNSDDIYSEEKLEFDFIRRTKCDVNHADKVIKKMNQDGLILCKPPGSFASGSMLFTNDNSTKYHLGKFAHLRGYLTIDEMASISNKRLKFKQELEDAEEKRKEKFIKKYGSDESKWSEEIHERFYETDEDP